MIEVCQVSGQKLSFPNVFHQSKGIEGLESGARHIQRRKGLKAARVRCLWNVSENEVWLHVEKFVRGHLRSAS